MNINKDPRDNKNLFLLISLAGGASSFFSFFIPIIVIILLVIGVSGGNTENGSNNNENITSAPREYGFTISRTSLSKEEYTNKLEEFSKTNKKFEIFYTNASDIYDYAVSANVNPELVVVRAYVEGRGSTTGKYNYWGMGCTNTGGFNACFDYTSFEEGYTDYINNISKYSSLAEMMSKYSYIGYYWYNPGSSSIGGCYYAKYIYTEENMPERVKNACSSSAPSCSKDNTSNCTKTTDEDQTAYANWQVKQNMATARKKIFGLEYNEGIG